MQLPDALGKYRQGQCIELLAVHVLGKCKPPVDIKARCGCGDFPKKPARVEVHVLLQQLHGVTHGGLYAQARAERAEHFQTLAIAQAYAKVWRLAAQGSQAQQFSHRDIRDVEVR
ncbi:hypothetical protein D3C85_1120880 [compost metagenome]